ncbi:MAG TPA: TA0938 family protein [Thermoplasmata archaeon]|nr:TA0938 family protein [Thermoplasmata archaeon]
MKRNYAGCAICDSTWGDVWAEVEGERMFFCCDLCLVQFRGLCERIKRETGWATIESLEITGDRRGRTCRASTGSRTFDCRVAFNPQGEIRRFEKAAPARQ